MNRKDIIEILEWHPNHVEHGESGLLSRIERVVAIAEQAEREACAQLCIEITQSKPLSNRVGWEHGTVDCAAAIRARGQR